VTAQQGGNTNLKIVDDLYSGREPREFAETAPTLRCGKCGQLKVVAGQIQPVNRDYKEDGEPRKEQFETRKDDLANTVLTDAGSNMVQIAAMRGRPDEHGVNVQRLEPSAEDVSHTLTGIQKDNLIIESQVLKMQRTEYGRATRKAYESHEIAGDRKAMREQVPRDDGLANTLTLQQRDNILIEAPYITDSDTDTSKCIRAGGHGLHFGHTWDVILEHSPFNLLAEVFSLMLKIEENNYATVKNSRNLLSILWTEVGAELQRWESDGHFHFIPKKEILQSGMYAESVSETQKRQQSIPQRTYDGEKRKQTDFAGEGMFDLWKECESRYSPYRWELSEQLHRKLANFMQELSYENTQSAWMVCALWGKGKGSRLLRQTLSTLQEIWRPTHQLWSRIRKLAPAETLRLMGWRDKEIHRIQAAGISNAQQYKTAGNGIVTTVLIAIFGELFCANYREILDGWSWREVGDD
jgi:hypothetical protein